MNSKSEVRQVEQRSLGWIGFSAIAHVGFLVVLLFSRMVHRTIAHAEVKPQPSTVTFDAPAPAKSVDREVVLTDSAPPTAVDTIQSPAAPVVITKKPIAVRRTQPHAKAPQTLVARDEPIAIQTAKPVVDDHDEKDSDPETLSPEITDKVDQPEFDEPRALTARPADQVAEKVEETPALVKSEPPPPVTEAAPGGEILGEPQEGAIVDASMRRPLEGNPLPNYPQRDRLLGTEGTAVVIGRVETTGQVSDVRMEKSSGSETIDQASIDAFKFWRFAPGPTATVRKAFAFNLQGEAKVIHTRLGNSGT